MRRAGKNYWDDNSRSVGLSTSAGLRLYRALAHCLFTKQQNTTIYIMMWNSALNFHLIIISTSKLYVSTLPHNLRALRDVYYIITKVIFLFLGIYLPCFLIFPVLLVQGAPALGGGTLVQMGNPVRRWCQCISRAAQQSWMPWFSGTVTSLSHGFYNSGVQTQKLSVVQCERMCTTKNLSLHEYQCCYLITILARSIGDIDTEQIILLILHSIVTCS